MNKEFVNYTSALWDSNLLSYAIRGKVYKFIVIYNCKRFRC